MSVTALECGASLRYMTLKREAFMKTLRKRIKARANAAKANLDAAILELRHTSLDQLMKKLEKTKSRLDGDMAWTLASGVLAKVKAVRNSLKSAPNPHALKRTKKKPAPKPVLKKARLVVKTRGAKVKSKPLVKRKAAKSALRKKSSRRVSA